MAERVTIKSIAKDLGISHMTVSRALSNHPNVLKETRERVQKRAQEMGYVKSAAAKVMRGDDTHIVGLLLPNIVNEFYARFANALALACQERALQLIIHLTGDEFDAEQDAIQRLREVQAQSVVMVPTPLKGAGEVSAPPSLRTIELIRQRDVGRAVPAILVDDSPAIADAVRHLAARGHTQIAYIGADRGLTSGAGRLAAFHAGLKSVGSAAMPDLISTGAPSSELGATAMACLLEKRRATAVVCGGVEIANGALRQLLAKGHSPQSPIDFVGYGDVSLYSWIGAGVTSIAIPVEALATAAAERLANPASGTDNEVETFKADLVVR